MTTEHVIKLDGQPVGYVVDDCQGVDVVKWFHRNAGGQSMAYYCEHGGYSVEDVPDAGLDCDTAAALFAGIMAREGLTVEAEFVPWSKSRNKGEKTRSLNWICNVLKRGSIILAGVDYMAGIAHAPAYKRLGIAAKFGRTSVDDAEALEWETEKGTRAPRSHSMPIGGKAIMPPAADVLGCLVREADVTQYGSFEEWAGEFGYDEDSRSAEAIYRKCLEGALKLQAGLGDVLAELQAVGQHL